MTKNTKQMADEKTSAKQERQGVLQRTIGVHVDRVIAWLDERFPDGYSKVFMPHWKIKGLDFYLFVRIGLNNEAQAKRRMKEWLARTGGNVRFGFVDPATGKVFFNKEDYEKARGRR